MTPVNPSPQLGLSPDQREVDAEKWEKRAEDCASRGLDSLAATYRELAAWARGEIEKVGPGLMDAAECRDYGDGDGRGSAEGEW